MVLPEVIFFAIGLIAVLVGAMWKKGDLRTTVDEGFRSFFESFWLPRRLPATVFIYLPVAIAIGRILPVLSNISLLRVMPGVGQRR